MAQSRLWGTAVGYGKTRQRDKEGSRGKGEGEARPVGSGAGSRSGPEVLAEIRTLQSRSWNWIHRVSTRDRAREFSYSDTRVYCLEKAQKKATIREAGEI